MLVLTYLFITPFIRRRVWLGWHNMTLAVLPISILPDSYMISLFPGIDETQSFFDKRHLEGKDIPDAESWQWSDKDMLVLARKNGLIPALNLNTKVDDVTVATASDEKPEAAVAAPAAAPGGRLAPLPMDANGFVLDKDGKPLSDWKSKVAKIKHTFSDPSIPLLQKAFIGIQFVFFAGVDRDIADYKTDDADVADLHSEATAERYFGKTGK